MKEIYLVYSTDDNQIKSKKQLSHLSKVVKFVSKKFDKLEKDRLEKEKLINVLMSEVSCFNKKMKVWELEWRSRSNVQEGTVFYCAKSRKIMNI